MTVNRLETTAASINAVDQVVTDNYAIYQGDSCELIRAVPGDSVDFGIHSPPFEGLYKFSNFDRDISNNDGPAFWEHYAFLISELLRVTKPGRLHSVHVMQLPTSKIRHGHIGMRDFRGEVVRAYEDAGWIFHSEVCIWKDPVIAQQRTKSIRLLHKQIEKDSAISGQGLADYIVTFRKPGDNDEPIDGMFENWIGSSASAGGIDISRAAYERDIAERKAAHDDPANYKPWPYDKWKSILVWQRYASPVWMDIRQTRTLQYRSARDEQDEQHISPLQLDVIERCIELWSAEGDVVLTPFLGIGSEVYSAVEMGRRGIGFELKPSYFRQSAKNIAALGTKEQPAAGLFDFAANDNTPLRAAA
ncbi:DNA methyltransferase [Mesorhizobium sp. M00.F.Ca.ET.217.01.1.1]|uniref:DNA-methyltransferase n=1 Tax=Mesorhizobium sp. M00.F.Ca.ET.217.01.1.1 TaxID=2500529 RepID=UPI000FDA620A|nr:DNA methyltransferase [Mesorhizobium sp. M00.F.Ca.ET.217.01.1.1]TGQ19303.1 site-specific DNA-methyltransferase [Mesorhizobium sp. M00.F.Ca.ET.217.01.1.1]